ncbi:MAG: SUMF1/EgtB/PvdO family nonheme iron enzyme [Acidobacteria bacterium]|nr:SUMF1/EgtB/PvdO family nonheme iron enzyme [Acidobacteriota bacterium]
MKDNRELVDSNNKLAISQLETLKLPITNSLTPTSLPKWSQGIIITTFLFAIIFIVYLALPKELGFTLIVRGAPTGSDILIDNINRGITLSDGSTKITYLKPGKRLIRVTKEGYNEFNTTVTATAGTTESIIAQLVALERKSLLPEEIDYNGKMILITAGEFILGSNNYLPNEQIEQKIYLPDYYIDKYEVTNGQYQRFCQATNRSMPSNPWWDENYFSNPNLPVVGITWNDANAYANWANKKLPSEAEWEKAAAWEVKVQKKRIWPWGDNPDPTCANINTAHPSQVNQYPRGASSYGVEDMAGNAAEWVDSFYQPYLGNQSPDTNYGTTNRVVRGGSFRSSFEDARTTRRFYHTPDFKADEVKNRSWLIGFRCAILANDSKLQSFLKQSTNK